MDSVQLGCSLSGCEISQVGRQCDRVPSGLLALSCLSHLAGANLSGTGGPAHCDQVTPAVQWPHTLLSSGSSQSPGAVSCAQCNLVASVQVIGTLSSCPPPRALSWLQCESQNSQVSSRGLGGQRCNLGLGIISEKKCRPTVKACVGCSIFFVTWPLLPQAEPSGKDGAFPMAAHRPSVESNELLRQHPGQSTCPLEKDMQGDS